MPIVKHPKTIISEPKQPRFYTLPPSRDIYHPWLFVTFMNRKELLLRNFEHSIMDCNVGLFFHHKQLYEYPSGFLDEYKKEAKILGELFGDKIMVSIPDYPADYVVDGKQTPSAYDNVARTLRNIRKFIKYDGVNWLPVIQSNLNDPLSFINSCILMKDIIGGDYPRIAIGTVCKSRNREWIKHCCWCARAYFPKSWIHAFGLTLDALPFVKDHIDSWDSMAWTFPRGRGLSSAKNIQQAREYFVKYMEKVREKCR